MSLRPGPRDIATPPSPNLRAPKLPLEEGLDHLRDRRWDHAIVALRIALQREPGRFAAVRALTTAHLLGGEPREARRVVEAFTNDCPMCADGWRLAAQLAWKLDCRARAIELLQGGLKRLPESTLLQHQLALFQAASIASSAPVTPAKAAPTAWPVPIRINDGPNGGGQDQDWLDQVTLDTALLRAVLTPHLQSTEELTVHTRLMLGEIEQKLARLLDAQSHHPDRQLLLARLQARLGAVESAMCSTDRALADNPNLPEARRLRAQLLGMTGAYDQAIEILQDLLKRGLDWPDIHYDIASLERQRGQAGSARAHLYSAIRLNPRFERARELLERCAA